MNTTFLAFLTFILINNTTCYVSNRTKSTEITTAIPTENETENKKIDVKDSDKKSEQKILQPDNGVILNDVIYSLKNQNWTSEEEVCLNQTLRMLQGLQNFTLWAVWEWDSIASEPQGLLYGNRYQLGNYDECLNAPWANIYPELKTQYCLTDIVLERTDNAVRRRVDKRIDPYQSALDYLQHRPPHRRALNELTWGVCVPSSCKPVSVERLMRTLLAHSPLGIAKMKAKISVPDSCQARDGPPPLDAAAYSFIGITILLSVVTLTCTYMNNRKNKHDPNSIKNEIINAFCLKKNSKDLMHMKKDGIEVLYGIRYLTIVMIVLDHQTGFLNAGPISNGSQVDRDLLSVMGMFILHDDLFVDTFFFLSAFLTANYLTKLKNLPNIAMLFIKRYFRLIIAFAVVVFYMASIFPYTGSGPLWQIAVNEESKPCKENWWLNMLLVHNYVNTENICMVVSWYIACDFHMFVLTVILYWIYVNSPKLGVTLAGIVTIVAFVMPGVINYYNHHPPVQLFTYEFVKSPRSNEQFHITYIKSHARYAAYIVGFFAGYIYTAVSANGNTKRISKKWSIIGVCLGLVIQMVVMLGGSTYLWRDFHPIEGAIYAAINRPLWVCGVALIVLCCAFGEVPLIHSFLSWYPWVPLSRLVYGLYLTHSIFIARNVFVARNPQHNDPIQVLTSAAGIVFWGCIAGYIIWLLIEAPANNLVTLLLKPRNNSPQQPKDKSALNASVNTLATTSSGHLRDNLPNTVYFSSKI